MMMYCIIIIWMGDLFLFSFIVRCFVSDSGSWVVGYSKLGIWVYELPIYGCHGKLIKQCKDVSNLDIANKSLIPFLFTISSNSIYIKCNMLSKPSKWELSLFHYIMKFTILRFIISRFEYIVKMFIFHTK